MESRPKSASLRLGTGELTDPFGEEARMVARTEFVESLHRLAPEVISDLMERLRPFLNLLTETKEVDQPPRCAPTMPPELHELLSEYHRVRKSIDSCGEESYTFYLLHNGTVVVDHPDFIWTAPSADVMDAHLAWARRWSLGDDHASWLVLAAAATCYVWMKQTLTGEGSDGRLHVGPYVEYSDRGQYSAEEARLLIDPPPHERSFALPDQRWSLRDEPKVHAYHRIMETLRRTVKVELDRIEAEALGRGDRPVSVRPAVVDHLEWLIRYHVKGEPYAVIARDVGRSRQAVMLAVRQAADLIDLPLREPDRRGRPRKTTPPRIVKVHAKHRELHN